MADQAHLLAVVLVGPQLFAQPPLIAPDHAGGCGQNMWGGPVVLLQPHHMRAREILFKAQDVAHLGPAPAIDRLIIVAHAANVLVGPCQKTQPHILGDVGVLIFVHQNVAEPALVLRQHIFVGLEDREHM